MLLDLRLYIITALAGLWTGFAFAGGVSHPLKPTYSQFREYCLKYRSGAEMFRVTPPPINEVVYVDIHALEAGQTRFSFDRFLASLEKTAKLEGLDQDKARKNGYKGAHDQGRSFYPKYRKTTGIFYRGKIYILDGHHRALISTYLGAESLPMEIIADWSHKSPSDFFNDMQSHGYTYFMDQNGLPMNLVDLCELIDDPYLLLARKIMLRVDLKFKDKDRFKITDVRGSNRPVAIKLNRDIPFFEFEIADRLRRMDFKWERGQEISNASLSQILESLKLRRDSERFAQVLLLDEPTSVKKLDLPKVIAEHFAAVQCEHQLMSGDSD